MSEKTPLYNEHVKLGGKIVDFAGWQMPIQYSGIINEHNAVRQAAGLFDVSHMGEFEFSGERALETVNYLTANNAATLVDGQAQYSMLLNERGTVIDDIILYRFSHDNFLMVVNAANAKKDFDWILSQKNTNVSISDKSKDFALIAFQGPKTDAILSKLTDIDLSSIEQFHFKKGSICNESNCIIARTGYTGERGFEIFCSPKSAPKIWQEIIEHGKQEGVLPIGLGARDTLRLEMKYSLYGHELTDQTNPLEAGLSWVVKLDKPCDFIGKDALIKIKAAGMKRKLIGFKMIDRGIPREGCKIFTENKNIGYVTSGTMSPSLKEPIGIGYVEKNFSDINKKFFIDIKGALREAIVVKTPFFQI